ncbi:unnamed protein product [Paramecium pentaurelia]|uniref:Uncharacterized protein n=1 Tax=Paramecium pentaurelia TaxID=43138 RepID=A0A8S1VZF5_9CILI|nr:unnamed protein product [Paramecium pentaurelia]
MGITKSKQYLLTTYELQEFADQANIQLEDVQCLYKIFQNLSSLIKDDGVIDFNEFHRGFQNKSQETTNLIFTRIDLNNDRVLNFREFLFGYATFLSQNKAAQIKYLFKLIDNKNENVISKEKITETLNCLLPNFPQIQLTKEEVEELIFQELDFIFMKSMPTFKQFNEDLIDEVQKEKEKQKTLDYQQFYFFLSENSYILEWLNLPKIFLKSN